MKRLSLTRLNARTHRDPDAPFPGDPCPDKTCDGVIHIYCTDTDEETGLVTRYMRCKKCKCKPEGSIWVEQL